MLRFAAMRTVAGASAVAMVVVGMVSMSAATGIERVAWLQGCWEMASGTRLVEEQWTRPRGGIMLGVGRTTRDGRLVEYETIVLTEKDGALAYEAHPSGQPAAVFALREIEDGRVLFANDTHDFPQRIGYRTDGPDRLLAWVEGTMKGQPRRIEFSYQRVACP